MPVQFRVGVVEPEHPSPADTDHAKEAYLRLPPVPEVVNLTSWPTSTDVTDAVGVAALGSVYTVNVVEKLVETPPFESVTTTEMVYGEPLAFVGVQSSVLVTELVHPIGAGSVHAKLE